MNTVEIKNAARENLKGRFGITLLAEVLGSALKYVAGLVPFGTILVGGALNVGITNVYKKGGEQKEVDLEDLFQGFRENFGENFLAGILKGLYLFLWSLLLIVPGVVKAYSYAMTEYIMTRETHITAVDAIDKSRKLMKGHKGELFLLDLSFFGWYLLTVLTCGIAGIYVIPYVSAAKTEFYKRIYENGNTEDMIVEVIG